MNTIGIWKRRVDANSDAFIYGIGNYLRTYNTLEDAEKAMSLLVAETNKYASGNVDRAYLRLRNARHPLFINK